MEHLTTEVNGSPMHFPDKVMLYTSIIQPSKEIPVHFFINARERTALAVVQSQKEFHVLCLCDDCIALHEQSILLPCIEKYGTDDVQVFLKNFKRVLIPTATQRSFVYCFLCEAIERLLKAYTIEIVIVHGDLGDEDLGKKRFHTSPYAKTSIQTLGRYCGKNYLPSMQEIT